MAHEQSLPVGDREDGAVGYNQPRLVKQVRERSPRRYTLFEERLDGERPRWVRVGAYAYPIEKARLVFGREIMLSYLKGEVRRDLRPV